MDSSKPKNSKDHRFKLMMFNGLSFSQAFPNLIQQLFIGLWRGNAKMLLGRVLLENNLDSVVDSS